MNEMALAWRCRMLSQPPLCSMHLNVAKATILWQHSLSVNGRTIGHFIRVIYCTLSSHSVGRVSVSLASAEKHSHGVLLSFTCRDRSRVCDGRAHAATTACGLEAPLPLRGEARRVFHATQFRNHTGIPDRQTRAAAVVDDDVSNVLFNR